jgi:TatD DNase family protein
VFIDTHAHIDDKAFSSTTIETILENAKKEKVRYIISPAIDIDSSIRLRDISEKYSKIYFAAGLHCHEASRYSVNDIERFRLVLEHEKAVAVGEVGLDYHYNFSPRHVQIDVLKEFFELAFSMNMPLILHCREAEKDLLELLETYDGKLKGVIHCYTGSKQFASEFLELGFYLGFTGIVTFRKSSEIREVAASTPVDRILTETDSPYMTPVPYRGKRNEPSFIPYIARELASIKGIPLETLEPVLLENASNCFDRDFKKE